MLRIRNITTQDSGYGTNSVEIKLDGDLTRSEFDSIVKAGLNDSVKIVPVDTHTGLSNYLKGDMKVMEDLRHFYVNVGSARQKETPLFGGAWYGKNGKLVYITRVMYNEPATIVFWNDGSKTVSKCAKGDTYNKETGLAIAILKKLLGNGIIAKTFTDWLPTDDKTKVVDLKDLRAKKRTAEKATKTK